MSWDVTTAFVDRDGTINVDASEGDYIRDWGVFAFLPRAKEALRLLTDLGLRVVVVTNQRGIALGRMRLEAVEDIHARMGRELAGAGATVDGFYLCPHDKDVCDCRKPGVGLFEQARHDFPEIEFGRSVMIGNTWIDMEAGRRAGARTVFVDEGKEDPGDVDLVVRSLWEAASALADRVDPRPRERALPTGPPRAPNALWDR